MTRVAGVAAAPPAVSVARRVAISSIRAYQRWLSPLHRAPCCRFVPSCSDYAIDAITAHGVVRGSARAVWRVLRCNPFTRGGYDPARALGAPAGEV
jgi:putative membrane protein insertion efficiency factor